MSPTYTGWKNEDGPAGKEIYTDSSNGFYANYIAKRRPCVLVGGLEQPQFKGLGKWRNPEYLKQRTGEVVLKVEERKDVKERFGMGNKVSMSFGDLLTRLEEGSEQFYLTTQELGGDEEEGWFDVVAPPVFQLSDDLPMRPSPLECLVPQQINLWIGNNRDGSTSGLHHDFHDNLYVLLRGRKRFLLFSPADADAMYTRGKIACVHPNGRIVYEGAGTVRADGLEEGSRIEAVDRRDTISERLESLQEDLEAAEGINDKKEVKRLKKEIANAENQLDEALDVLLAMDGEGGDGEGEGEEGEGEGESEEEEDVAGQVLEWGMREGTGGLSREEATKRRDEISERLERLQEKLEDAEKKKNSKEVKRLKKDIADGENQLDEVLDVLLELDEVEGDVEEEPENETKNTENGENSDSEADQTPPSFSRMGTVEMGKASPNEFPLFKNKEPIVVDLGPGDCLYLPASWFHEVISFGEKVEGEGEGEGKPGIHMAVNYWFYPPDGETSDRPYVDGLWERRWARRMGKEAEKVEPPRKKTRVE